MTDHKLKPRLVLKECRICSQKTAQTSTRYYDYQMESDEYCERCGRKTNHRIIVRGLDIKTNQTTDGKGLTLQRISTIRAGSSEA